MDELFYKNVNLEEYMLTEAIRLKTSVTYGLNYPEFNDKRSKPAKVLSSVNSEFSSIFKVEDRHFVMDFVSGKFQFRTCGYLGETPDVDMMLNSALISKRKYDADLPYQVAVKVFGYALAVMISLANQHNITEVSFTGYSTELQKLYNAALQKNRFLANDLSMIGWVARNDAGIIRLTKQRMLLRILYAILARTIPNNLPC